MTILCTKCDSRMVFIAEGEPMHCMVCGTDGVVVPTPKRARKSLLYTARYSGVSDCLTNTTVHYRLGYGKQNGIPSITAWCPWCGVPWTGDGWVRLHKEDRGDTNRMIQCHCELGHRYDVVCTHDGDYYWK